MNAIDKINLMNNIFPKMSYKEIFNKLKELTEKMSTPEYTEEDDAYFYELSAYITKNIWFYEVKRYI